MKPTPKGWPRISSAIFYDDAAAAIDWLQRAFGFEVRVRVEAEDGTIKHSQLTLSEGLVMVGQAGADPDGSRAQRRSPASLEGANTQSLCVHVDDADAHCEQARREGATIVSEPATQDYGEDYWADRTYEAVDPEGHHWWFVQRLRG